MTLSADLPGTWRLLSRIDRDEKGRKRPEPGLGADPVALLVYDRAGHFSAQFMRRDRSEAAGFDAYFGTYEVDDATGEVTQRLDGALDPAMVGTAVTRTLALDGDTLIIRLTPAPGLVRTLIWTRVG